MLIDLVPLLLAAISGLAYLAVKHPSIYEKLFGKIYLASSIITLALLFWTTAMIRASIVLLPFTSPEKMLEANKAIDSVTIPYYLTIIAHVLFSAYLFFLSWVSNQIQNEKQNSEKS